MWFTKIVLFGGNETEGWERGAGTGLCELVTIGPQFSPTGFGFGFVKTAPISVPFNRAIQELMRNGTIEL